MASATTELLLLCQLVPVPNSYCLVAEAQELKLQPNDCMSIAQTTTPPSHMVTIEKYTG